MKARGTRLDRMFAIIICSMLPVAYRVPRTAYRVPRTAYLSPADA